MADLTMLETAGSVRIHPYDEDLQKKIQYLDDKKIIEQAGRLAMPWEVLFHLSTGRTPNAANR